MTRDCQITQLALLALLAPLLFFQFVFNCRPRVHTAALKSEVSSPLRALGRTRQVLAEAVNLPDLSIPRLRKLHQLGAVKERWSLLSLFLFHLLLHLRHTEVSADRQSQIDE